MTFDVTGALPLEREITSAPVSRRPTAVELKARNAHERKDDVMNGPSERQRSPYLDFSPLSLRTSNLYHLQLTNPLPFYTHPLLTHLSNMSQPGPPSPSALSPASIHLLLPA